MLLQEILDTRSKFDIYQDEAIAALHRRLVSKGDTESTVSAAYEVGRSFGIPARKLAAMYDKIHNGN